MSAQSSTIVQRLWNYCNVLRDERRLSVVGEVESAVEVDLVRVASEARLRHIIPVGGVSSLEGRL